MEDFVAQAMALSAIAKAGKAGDAYTKAQTDALLDGKADLVDGKIPASELPSYVDDVLEYASTAAFPTTGESGKIYVATDTNKTYRWSGTGYREISESLALGETASTAYAGNKGKANADAIAAIKDGTNIDSFADVETALANIPHVTVDQTYSASSTNAQSGVAIEGKKPGLKTTGTQYTISGQTVTAGTGAEVFNNYTGNKASSHYSHAEGSYSTASGRCSHAEGSYSTASGDYSHVEGYNTTASGDYSHVEGYNTTASGGLSHAEGYNTTASAYYSHVEGYYTTAGSQYQHVQGKYNVADSSNTYAFIIGNGTADDARHNAFAIDWNGLIYVNGAATGVDVTKKPGEITTGKQYTIDGSTVTAGDGAEVFNNYTVNIASGSDSHAEGGYTRASGNYSHAEGYNTTASGSDSHAEGNGTTASSGHSHAEGYNTTASGSDSHAEGNGTTASGNYSHAEGLGTRASEWGSHAEGRYTTAASQYQHAQGKFNVEDSSDTYAFIIGNGTSSSARHNAFAIDWNGLIYVNGAATGVDVSQLTPVTVDQTFDGTSSNAQSGLAVQEAISGDKYKIYISQANATVVASQPFTAPDGSAKYVNTYVFHLRQVKPSTLPNGTYIAYTFDGPIRIGVGDTDLSASGVVTDYTTYSKTVGSTETIYFGILPAIKV